MKNYCVFFLVVSIFISCSEENESGGITYYKINESLFPFLFDQGSYWIYQNTNDNSIIDSVVLISLLEEEETQMIGKGYLSKDQVFHLTYQSSKNGTFSEYLIGYVIAKESVNAGFIYLSSRKIGDSSRNASIKNIHGELQINGMAFKDVVEMDIEKAEYISDEMNLFYADSVGLVKKQIKNGNNITEDWELLRYEVHFYEVEN